MTLYARYAPSALAVAPHCGVLVQLAVRSLLILAELLLAQVAVELSERGIDDQLLAGHGGLRRRLKLRRLIIGRVIELLLVEGVAVRIDHTEAL